MKRWFYHLRQNLDYLFALRGDYLRISYRDNLRLLDQHRLFQKIRKNFLNILILILVIVGIIIGYSYPGVGFSKKTLWDWMELLIIPILLFWLALYFSNEQKQRDLVIAELGKGEKALQEYFDYMTQLLFENDLSDESQKKTASRLARARTMAILDMLTGKQKGHLFRFQIEADLMHRDRPFFSMARANFRNIEVEPGSYHHTDLKGANFDGAKLSWCDFNSVLMTGVTMQNADLESADFGSADLNYALLTQSDLYKARLSNALLLKAVLVDANLEGADLRGARLRNAKMKGVNLRNANLQTAYMQFSDLAFANLRDADLTGADMMYANFHGANLSNADLTDTDLRNSNINKRQLKKAKSIQGAKLPTILKKKL